MNITSDRLGAGCSSRRIFDELGAISHVFPTLGKLVGAARRL
jgi:hypothetical protein